MSHEYHDQLPDEDSGHRIRAPRIKLDAGGTTLVEAKAHEAFEGILEVPSVAS